MSRVITRDMSTTYDKTALASTSTVTLWCPCDETGTVTTLADAVSSSTFAITSTTATGGGVQLQSDATQAFSGTLPTLSGSFAFMLVYDPGTSATAVNVQLGDASPKLQLSNGGSSIVGASGTASLGNMGISSGKQKYLIVSDVENTTATLYQSAVGSGLSAGTASTTAHGTINFDSENFNYSTFASDAYIYGMALIDMSTNGIPHDFMLWADMTMEKWAANSKVFGAGFASF